MTNEEWKRLNISQGKSSYSQERIWLDETIRSMILEQNENLYNYNSILLYQIEDGCLTIKRFRQALKTVLDKHEIFRTSLEYDLTEHCVKQKINSLNDQNSSFEISYLNPNDSNQLNQLIYQEQIDKSFNLNEGKIFRCHLLKANIQDKNHLIPNDYILFIFHHSSIDEYSKYLFLKELTFVYQHGKLNSDQNQLRYIDYSSHERQLDLNKCEQFWEDFFSNYNFKQKLHLPYDDRKFNSISSGSFYFFQIDKSLTRQIFRYKQKLNTNFFRLFLSIYSCYLFKLTQDNDISITGITPNRYHQQLNDIIGPLENLIIYRVEIDPNKSFFQLLTQVDQLCLDIKEHSYYPYQKLISYARKFSSIQYPFSQVALRLWIDDDRWILDIDNNLILKKILLTNNQLFPRDNKLTPIELTLNVICNLPKQTIEFYFDYSNKLFQEETIQLFAQRFEQILKHLFDVSSTFDLEEEPIYKLSIILPHEQTLMHKINTNNDSL